MGNKICCIFIIAIILAIISLSGCEDVDIGELTQFSITKFEVEPTIVNEGESANLSWVVLSAESVSIDQGVGSVSNTGTRIVMPTETTIYTLTAVNATKTLTATTQIVVKSSSGSTEKERASVTLTGSNNQIKILLMMGGTHAPYPDVTGNSGFDIYVNGSLMDRSQWWTIGGEWEPGESIILTADHNNNPLNPGTEYAVTVKIMGTVIYDSYITVLA